jgi:hypothetical protein
MPFGSSKSAHPEDEDAVQQDTPVGNADEGAEMATQDDRPAGNGQTQGEP